MIIVIRPSAGDDAAQVGATVISRDELAKWIRMWQLRRLCEDNDRDDNIVYILGTYLLLLNSSKVVECIFLNFICV